MKALIFLVDGFEEIEVVATIDTLRRGNVDVTSVSVTGNKQVIGSHNIPIIADILFEEADFSKAEMIILPGGTVALNQYDGLKEKIVQFDEEGKKIAAICAAPMILGGLGLLKGKRATCYPGFEHYLEGATFLPEPVIIDGNIITGQGPGFTIDFALTLLEILKDKETADKVATNLLIK